VRLASPELVDRAVLDKDAWASGVVGTWSAELYVFAGDFRDGTCAVAETRGVRPTPRRRMLRLCPYYTRSR
jgi:hypothetical protein